MEDKRRKLVRHTEHYMKSGKGHLERSSPSIGPPFPEFELKEEGVAVWSHMRRLNKRVGDIKAFKAVQP